MGKINKKIIVLVVVNNVNQILNNLIKVVYSAIVNQLSQHNQLYKQLIRLWQLNK